MRSQIKIFNSNRARHSHFPLQKFGNRNKTHQKWQSKSHCNLSPPPNRPQPSRREAKEPDVAKAELAEEDKLRMKAKAKLAKRRNVEEAAIADPARTSREDKLQERRMSCRHQIWRWRRATTAVVTRSKTTATAATTSSSSSLSRSNTYVIFGYFEFIFIMDEWYCVLWYWFCVYAYLIICIFDY